ncbi:hypothetical protein PA598K_06645 [Paenibacillus sp. 598K]|nr:hypothetical protein PA598K_06645 [Paenibacillus sp. 598K]
MGDAARLRGDVGDYRARLGEERQEMLDDAHRSVQVDLHRPLHIGEVQLLDLRIASEQHRCIINDRSQRPTSRAKLLGQPGDARLVSYIEMEHLELPGVLSGQRRQPVVPCLGITHARDDPMSARQRCRCQLQAQPPISSGD